MWVAGEGYKKRGEVKINHGRAFFLTGRCLYSRLTNEAMNDERSTHSSCTSVVSSYRATTMRSSEECADA